MEGSTKYLSNM